MRHATKRKPAHRGRTFGQRVSRTTGVAGRVLLSPYTDAEALVGAMANPDSGIRFVLGIVKRAGKRASEVQSVIFDRVKWTTDAAKVWLRDHGFATPKVDEGATFWRFRQQDPKHYKEFRTVVPGTQRNPLKFGDRPYDLAQGETGRFHVVDERGFIRWKTALGVKAYDHAGNLSDQEPGLFQVIDTRDGSVYGAYRGGEPVEENPGRPWPKVYKTLKVAEAAWYDSDPGRNDLATYKKVRGGYQVVPDEPWGDRGHYGTTVDDMERGDTGFVEENPTNAGTANNPLVWEGKGIAYRDGVGIWWYAPLGTHRWKIAGGTTSRQLDAALVGGQLHARPSRNPAHDTEVGHYEFVDGVRIGLGHAGQILYASNWKKLWKLSAAGDPRLRKESYGPSTYGDTALFYTGAQSNPITGAHGPHSDFLMYAPHEGDVTVNGRDIYTGAWHIIRGASSVGEAQEWIAAHRFERPGHKNQWAVRGLESEHGEGAYSPVQIFKRIGNMSRVVVENAEQPGGGVSVENPTPAWPPEWKAKVDGLLRDWHEAGRAEFESHYGHLNYDTYATKSAMYGRKWANLDEGGGPHRSGAFMLNREDGNIYRIKAYGVPNLRKFVGHLDTVSGQDLYSRRRNPGENPTPGEAISAYDEHLATTTDPAFALATPDEQAAAMTVQDAVENPYYAWAVQEVSPISGWHTVSTWITHEAADKMAKELAEETGKTHRVMHKDSGRVYQTFGGAKEGNPGTLRGFRLYDTRDHRYYGGLFKTEADVNQYAVYMGILPDAMEIRPGTADWYDEPWPIGSRNPSSYDSQHPDLGQAAFDAGKDFRLSGAYHETGVANARVAGYGFNKWYPGPTKGYRKATLKKNWMEGWAAGKRVEKKQGNPRSKRQTSEAYLNLPIEGMSQAELLARKQRLDRWLDETTGPKSYSMVLEAWEATRKALSRIEGKANPESPAQELFEQFHGRPSAETLEITTSRHEHAWLTGLGTLVELKVATVTQLDATISFAKDKTAPQLCSSEDGRQLYIEGGDQALDLKALKMAGDKWEKDSMVIGVLYELTYQTAKKFHKFKLTDYFHKLGEESGVQPTLLYDPTNRLLSVSGGQYQVKPEGIVN
jgi:hypothetical protein